MALGWDYRDLPHLVAELAPHASQEEEAKRLLYTIYRGFAAELYREQEESQKNEQVKQELEALRKALKGLSGRATNLLCEELDDRLYLPFPYEQAQAVINPCREGVPATRLEPGVRLHALGKAIDEVLNRMPKDLRPGQKGVVGDATYKVLNELCRLYCFAHDAPFPSWDSTQKITRNQGALDFAISCMHAWGAPGMEGLWADELIRGLIHYRRKNKG